MSCTKSIAAGRCKTSRFPPASTEAALRAEYWRHVWRLVLAWAERRRQRDALSELDARLLDDIGVSPDAARQEAQKPFWRP
jgi:uncharacterized protein YjiS (DUF1127 family)